MSHLVLARGAGRPLTPRGARGRIPRAPRRALVAPSLRGDGADVGGLLALGAVHDVELDLLALGEAAVAVTRDGREVDEDVVAVGTGDEPVPLLVAEPLDCS